MSINLMREKWTFYCDESGNTGSNWLDVNQPFFIYGGWLVPDARKDSIVTNINALLSRYPSVELKSQKFFKKSKGDEYFKLIFDFLLNVPAIPIFIVADKKYCVATKIMETFFDPIYNQSLKDQITRDSHLKKQLAEIVLDNDVISRFSDLISAGTLELDEMKSIQSSLAKLYSKMPSLYNNISNISENGLKRMIDEFNIPNTSRTLTVSTLCHLMQVLQKFIEKIDLEVAIVHDSILSYDELIKIIKDSFLSEGEGLAFKIQSSLWYTKLPNISSLEFKDSKAELMIQLSDLLCGFILRCFRKIETGIELTSNEKSALEAFLVLHDELYSWDFIFPDKLIRQYATAIGLNPPAPSPIDLDKINHLFSKYLK